MNLFTDQLGRHIEVMQSVQELAAVVEQVAQRWIQTLNASGKILLMGNGGSAADAQHIAAELVGRYLSERSGLAAVSLTTDTSILTAVGNDYGYETVFSRQVEALARPGDVVVGYSTSGNSANICNAVNVAKKIGCYCVALTGATGGKLASLVDSCICVPFTETPRIQEAHAFIGHMLCEHVDRAFAVTAS